MINDCRGLRCLQRTLTYCKEFEKNERKESKDKIDKGYYTKPYYGK